MKREKHAPHIIAASAFAVFIVLGLACASVADPAAPKSVDRNLGVYNPNNLPDDQLCTLEIVGGIRVRQINGVTVGDRPFMGETALAGWGVGGYNANLKGSSVVAVIRIPAGSNRLLTSFYIGNAEQHLIVRDVMVSHDFVAGNTYRLNAALNLGAAGSLEMWSLHSIPYRAVSSISFIIEDRDVTNH